jgi:two-component sensor histidine kinase
MLQIHSVSMSTHETHKMTAPLISGYIVAVVSVFVMAGLRLSLNSWLQGQSRFILFLPAVMLASWYGSVSSALLALALGAGGGMALSVPPFAHNGSVTNTNDLLGMALYVMAGLMILCLNELQRRDKLRAETSQHAAEQARTLLEERQDEIERLNERLQLATTETYHRVKNNLQVVSALVDMQLIDGCDTVPARELERVNQHVQALALINDLLTQQCRRDGSASHVSADVTFDKLLALIPSNVGNRRIHCDVQTMPLTVKQGTTLALLVNELISNAIKHGEGDIDLTLSSSGGLVRLEVCDDGPGFPPGFDPITAANTGLDLISNLTRWDLRGDIHYENAPPGGARVIVTFPAEAKADTPEHIAGAHGQ